MVHLKHRLIAKTGIGIVVGQEIAVGGIEVPLLVAGMETADDEFDLGIVDLPGQFSLGAVIFLLLVGHHIEPGVFVIGQAYFIRDEEAHPAQAGDAAAQAGFHPVVAEVELAAFGKRIAAVLISPIVAQFRDQLVGGIADASGKLIRAFLGHLVDHRREGVAIFGAEAPGDHLHFRHRVAVEVGPAGVIERVHHPHAVDKVGHFPFPAAAYVDAAV